MASRILLRQPTAADARELGTAPSIALVRSCGFALEGYSPRYFKIGGRWRDHERRAIVAS